MAKELPPNQIPVDFFAGQGDVDKIATGKVKKPAKLAGPEKPVPVPIQFAKTGAGAILPPGSDYAKTIEDLQPDLTGKGGRWNY